MEREESFITMKLIWHSYLILSLGNYAHETPIYQSQWECHKSVMNIKFTNMYQ